MGREDRCRPSRPMAPFAAAPEEIGAWMATGANRRAYGSTRMPARPIDIVERRYLPFESWLLEVFVGLIMVLGTTNSVAVPTLRSDYGVNALLAAAFGAAVAWGIVVGALNVLSTHFKRTKRKRILEKARAQPDPQRA